MNEKFNIYHTKLKVEYSKKKFSSSLYSQGVNVFANKAQIKRL